MSGIEEIIESWGLDPAISISVPRLGSMNESWLVELADRRVVLRRHRGRSRTAVVSEHRVIAHAAAEGIPVPQLITTPDGESIFERDGRLYSLYSWAPGVQVDRSALTVRHAHAMGSMLGELHLALHGFDAGPPAAEAPRDINATLAGIDRIIMTVQARDDCPTSDWAITFLTAWRDWLRSTDPIDLGPLGDLQTIHGDYQETNLFFEAAADAVSCVIDWDKHRTYSRAFEVVRTIHHGLGMRVELAHPFVDGYRAVVPLPPQVLAAGARHFGQEQAHSLWLFEQVYIAGSVHAAHRAGEAFRPFDEAWRELSIE